MKLTRAAPIAVTQSRVQLPVLVVVEDAVLPVAGESGGILAWKRRRRTNAATTRRRSASTARGLALAAASLKKLWFVDRKCKKKYRGTTATIAGTRTTAWTTTTVDGNGTTIARRASVCANIRRTSRWVGERLKNSIVGVERIACIR